MAYSAEFNKKMVTFDGLDVIFDEKGSRFLSLRKVQWVNEGDEPDESKAKLEMRKYTIGKDGEEVYGKGVTFLTEEGPHSLVKEFISNGFGHTKDILEAIITRDDFKDTVEHLGDDKNGSVGEDKYFDMRSLLLGVAAELDEEEEEG